MTTFPPQSQKIKARAAYASMPEKVRPHYVAHYVLAGSRYGEFAGLVCSHCNHWREYGHTERCPVRRLEPGYRWRRKIIKRIGRRRVYRKTTINRLLTTRARA